MRSLLVPVLCALAAAACGDNLRGDLGDAAIADDAAIDDDATIADDAATTDAATTDAATTDGGPPLDASCPGRAPGQVGGACVTDAECDSAAGAGDGVCLRGPSGTVVWPAQGFCVNRLDACTTDAQCGTGNQCATIADPGGAFRACLPACGTGACTCSDGQICAGSFSGSALDRPACLPGNNAAIDGAACVGFGDCAEDSLCLADPLESPRGQCARIGCTRGDDSTCATGGDGHCVAFSAITAGHTQGDVCVDRCVSDADCREADGYQCVDGGGTVGRYCRHPQAGDACTTDATCGPAAQWDCKTGLTFPGGQCTPTTGCPTPGSGVGCSPGSSICFDSVLPLVTTDNVCVDRCGGPQNTQGGCRTGYVCRDVDPALGTTTLGCVNP